MVRFFYSLSFPEKHDYNGNNDPEKKAIPESSSKLIFHFFLGFRTYAIDTQIFSFLEVVVNHIQSISKH
jgi:hypothetical protein